MRKLEKSQVIDILDTFDEVLVYVKHQNSFENVECKQLLSDLSQNITVVCDFIIEKAGEEISTVSLLKEFKDKIENIHSDESGVIKRLRKDLIKIKNSLLYNKEKLEVVFFPYCADMWDCLESIYFAAKEDEQCNVFCVPIPWYDKNPNGTVHTVHYDGSKFPKNIEITNYLAYDVEAHHPDVIFIHNPYDECNLATSVDPSYFSAKLKSYTDCLVYVDYGMTHWLYDDVKKERETILKQHFVLPAYIHCDLYPVYSKKLAETVEMLLLLNRIGNKQSIEKKVTALGSAKFDKVLNYTRDDYLLPQPWSELLGNTDKKIVLLNTSISSVLNDTETYLARLRIIMNVFKGINKILLWWRPHPLMGSIFDSMRPRFAKEYREIVEEYCCDGWGIFDDTSDLHRAIAWSDAYYGDESSLIYLYCATGKPFTLTSQLTANADWLTESDDDFHTILRWRINNMENHVEGTNCCVWWNNFSSSEKIEVFLQRFIHYILHTDEYSEAKRYKELQLKLFYDFVENPDGTAGSKIYNYCKQKVLGVIK